jgi:hypothetical protein
VIYFSLCDFAVFLMKKGFKGKNIKIFGVSDIFPESQNHIIRKLRILSSNSLEKYITIIYETAA